jgi:plasmid maintenance system antidote protein VapI
MKIKKELLLAFMKNNAMSNESLANALGIAVAEVEKMLNGEAVGEYTARKFIFYLGADEAQKIIDWQAIGKKNPLG